MFSPVLKVLTSVFMWLTFWDRPMMLIFRFCTLSRYPAEIEYIGHILWTSNTVFWLWFKRGGRLRRWLNLIFITYFGAGTDGRSSASSKIGSAIVSSISSISSIAGSVGSELLPGRDQWIGTTMFCSDTAVHRAKLAVIAAAVAICSYSGSSSVAKRAPVLLVWQENERSFSSFCSSIESLHASSKPAIKLSSEVRSVI